tara:strand:+ start:1576 stop:2244 length:669 start_codon:yes stop_codon:yes gene_type:complete
MEINHNSIIYLSNHKSNNDCYSIINVFQDVYEKLFHNLDNKNIMLSFKNGFNYPLYGNVQVIIHLIVNYITNILPYVLNYDTKSQDINIDVITKNNPFNAEYYGIEIKYITTACNNNNNTKILKILRRELSLINGFLEIDKYIKNYQEQYISCILYIPKKFKITFRQFVSSINKLNNEDETNDISITNPSVKDNGMIACSKDFINNYYGKLIKVKNQIMTII